ncbi:hypothetical protein B0H19DRAFT_1210704 [Mycena capillaripes]|nr:hypothetical protein B0H19DRAFT_1210704 [Mycena capillaripes]
MHHLLSTPLDGSLSVPQIYDSHFYNSPNHKLFVFACADGSMRTIYWPEAVHAAWVGAKLLRDRFKWVPSVAETPVVAILATSNTISYFTLINSCFRANYVVFPISPRNSFPAIAHLLDKVGVKHLLIGHESSMQELAVAALDILKEKYRQRELPDVSHVPLFEELFFPENERTLTPESVPYEYKGPDATVLILHSSGSTAFPKPIYWSNQRTLETMLIPWFGERDLTDQRLSLHATPMYHIMGILQIFWSASSGLVITSFEPKPIPMVPTPTNFFDGAKATETDLLLSVPSFVEAWSREPEYVRWLASRTGVLYSGDHLTSQGVTVFILSEAGIMSTVLPAEVGPYDWEYFHMPALVMPEMIPYGNNTFELVMLSNVFCTPAVLNIKVRGIGAYATSDLLLPHPTKPGYWKVFGRTDDQIMHNTGEKTNPGPLESLWNQDPHVQSSVMFGRGRFQAGVIVDPKPAYRFDPTDQVKLAEFRNMIWLTVLKMNDIAPQHSRLFKEFTYTAKMTVRREAVIAEYEEEVEILYNMVDESTTLNIPPLANWRADSVRNFVRTAIFRVLNTRVGDEDDIFQHRWDSLQATWIRNALLRTLHEHTRLDTRRDTRNFVYEYPTVARLGEYIFGSISETGRAEEEKQSTEAKTSAMLAMAAKNHRSTWVLPPGSAAGLDPGILGSEKLSLLEGDLTEPNLGVSEEAYKELYKRVTHIIHSDWPVNFNITLGSFEPNVQGLRNLVDFSLTSPFSEPRTLLYASSIGVFHSTPTELHARGHPEVAIEAAVAAGNGYQQSKWIAEEILRIAGESYATAKMLVVRNAHEWVPAIFQSGKFVGCLPDDSRDVSWIPVQLAAAAIVDFLDLPTGKILHLINPKSVPWRTLAAAAAFELGVQLVSYANWLSRLETATNVQKNIATSHVPHLLHFFRSLSRKEISQEEAFGLMKLDMFNALSGSEYLRVMDLQLAWKDMEQWIKYWRSIDLL